MVEALCPCDRGDPSKSSSVLDISDRELCIFLQELKQAKGARITVILDCCHSGGAARDAITLEGVRSSSEEHPLREALLNAADDDPRRKRGSRLANDEGWGDWDESSCVLFAACLRHELAKERRFTDTDNAWHGYFTRALLAVLRSQQGSTSTYAELCNVVTKYMPTYGNIRVQNPLLVGGLAGSRLWYAR